MSHDTEEAPGRLRRARGGQQQGGVWREAAGQSGRKMWVAGLEPGWGAGGRGSREHLDTSGPGGGWRPGLGAGPCEAGSLGHGRGGGRAGAGPSRPRGPRRDSPSLVRLARAPFALGRLLSSSFSIASW